MCSGVNRPAMGRARQVDDGVDPVEQVGVGSVGLPLALVGVGRRAADQAHHLVAASGQQRGERGTDQTRGARHRHPQGFGMEGASPLVGGQVAGELALAVVEHAPQPPGWQGGVDGVGHPG